MGYLVVGTIFILVVVLIATTYSTRKWVRYVSIVSWTLLVYFGLWYATMSFGCHFVLEDEASAWDANFVSDDKITYHTYHRAYSPAPFIVRLRLSVGVNRPPGPFGFGGQHGFASLEEPTYLWLFGYKTRIAGPDPSVRPQLPL